MDILNSALTILFTTLLTPFRGMHPLAGLAAVSVAAGALMLLVFKWTSNQKGLAAARDRMQGRLLEMRLFASDPAQTLRSAGMLLLDNLSYIRHMLVPMLILIGPIVLLLVQASAWFQFRPVLPGESVIVRAVVSDSASEPDLDRATLDAGPGVTVETPPLRISEQREINWRVNPDNPGRHILRVKIGGTTTEKKFAAGRHAAAAWPARVSGSAFERALNPGEPAIRNAMIQKISIDYPERKLLVFGRPVHWLVVFFVLSLASAYALRGAFRVEV